MTHKLLLADDSVTIQRVIELTFADEDIDVTTVGDGQLAIDRLDADPPDIILADIDMPKRDGYEVAAYVKSRPRLAHIPVVLLTGAFEPIDQARAAAAGSSDVLAKPFEPQMVINRVKELLGRKRPDEDGSLASLEASLAAAPPQTGPQPAGRQSAAEGAEPVSLDDYFDQLDAAFSNLQPGAQPTDGGDEVDWPPLEPPAPPVEQPPALASVAVEKPLPAAPRTSEFAPAPAAAHAAAPAQSFAAEPTPAPEAAAFAPTAPASKPADIAPVAFSAPAHRAPGVPSAPDAERTQRTCAPVAPDPRTCTVATRSPTGARTTANPFANLSAAKAEAAARPAAPVISDEVIEEIVSRVLQRMSDRVVRETVTDIVSQTAERLVQEEIERIKTGS